jgi:hypothetical protein
MTKTLTGTLLLMLLITACAKNEKPQSPSLAYLLAQGIWRINLMQNGGSNITSAYSPWQFVFQGNKTLKITDGLNEIGGNWREDTLRQKLILNVNSSAVEFILISQEWDIHYKTPARLTFRDNKISPSQELQFTRN